MIGNCASLERPKSVKELLSVLARVEPPRYLLAGGTDILVKSKDGIVPPGTFIDIWQLQPELRYLREDGDSIELGALFTMTDGERSPVLRELAPALVIACREAGAVQIRNRATLGGNSANASPAGDTIPALYSLGATIVLGSVRGVRSLPIEQFFKGPGKTVLEKDEAILAFRFPRKPGSRGTWMRLGQRQAQAISKISLAVTASFGRDGSVSEIKVAFGAVAPTVIRAPKTEAFLTGRKLDESTIRLASERVLEEVFPISDIRSTAEYRREQAGVLLARALRAIAPV